MSTLYTSRHLQVLGIALVLALILLWVSNTFLTLPFDLDPRLLRKPDTGAVSETGFEGVEALVNEDNGGSFGGFGWNIGGNKLKESDDGNKLWFFGKAGVQGSDDGSAVEHELPKSTDGTGIAFAENEKSIWTMPSGLLGGNGQSKTLPFRATPTLALTEIKPEEEWFRLHFTTSAAESTVAAVTASGNGDHFDEGASEHLVSSTNAVLASANPATPESLSSIEALSNEYAAGIQKKPPHAASITSPTTSPMPSSAPLILYAFSASDWALPNLRFFLTHALHAHATFIFILNGALPLTAGSKSDLEVDPVLLNVTEMISAYGSIYSNIKIVKRPNTCYDLGAFAEVLLSPSLPQMLNLNSSPPANASEPTLYSLFSRFILLNASLRGPFIPLWSRECWSDAYLRPIDDRSRDWKGQLVKAVGMTMNCVDNRPRHLQSMILATDSIGIGVLLGLQGQTSKPPPSPEVVSSTGSRLSNIGLNACPATYDEAVNIEVSLTDLLIAHNYTVSAMMALAHKSKTYVETCTNNDVNYREGAYEGGDLSVWETMWIKTRWGVDHEMVERISGWLDAAVDAHNEGDEADGNSEGKEVVRGRSWDVC